VTVATKMLTIQLRFFAGLRTSPNALGGDGKSIASGLPKQIHVNIAMVDKVFMGSMCNVNDHV